MAATVRETEDDCLLRCLGMDARQGLAPMCDAPVLKRADYTMFDEGLPVGRAGRRTAEHPLPY